MKAEAGVEMGGEKEEEDEKWEKEEEFPRQPSTDVGRVSRCGLVMKAPIESHKVKTEEMTQPEMAP